MTNRGRIRPSGNSGGTAPATFKDATDIEEAAHAINAINRRTRTDAKAREQIARSKVSLSSALDAWLKKDVP